MSSAAADGDEGPSEGSAAALGSGAAAGWWPSSAAMHRAVAWLCCCRSRVNARPWLHCGRASERGLPASARACYSMHTGPA